MNQLDIRLMGPNERLGIQMPTAWRERENALDITSDGFLKAFAT